MERRAFLTTAVAAPLLATEAGATIQELSVAEQIQYHTLEISRLLRDSVPDGGYTYKEGFFVVDNELVSHAFPNNYDRGQTYAIFEPETGEWTLTS